MRPDLDWAKRIAYNEETARSVFSWLEDPRQFTVQQLGLDWLLELAARGESIYTLFADSVIAFRVPPEDFADGNSVEAGFEAIWGFLLDSRKESEWKRIEDNARENIDEAFEKGSRINSGDA